MSDPVMQGAGCGGRQSVPAGIAMRRGRCAGLAEQIVPGTGEQLCGDDLVGVALGDEDRQMREPTGLDRNTRVERQRAVEDRGAGVPSRVGQDETAGKRSAAAETDQDHRPPDRRHLVEPVAEPAHGRCQGLRDRSADASVGEPREPAAVADRRPDCGVCSIGGQVRCEREDLALVRAAAVQQDDQRRGGVRGAVGRHNRRVERGHDGSTGTSSAAVRTPPQRATSPVRSSRSTGAAFSYSPQ